MMSTIGRLFVSGLVVALCGHSNVLAVTPQQLPQFSGVVFGLEATGGQPEDPTVVFLLVFNEGLGVLREYRVDVTDQTVMSVAQHSMTVISAGQVWRVPVDGGEGYVEFARASTGHLLIDGEGSAAQAVDYQSNVHLSGSSCTYCAWACVWNGCCQCCLCVHRCMGIPEILDKLCCEWLEENYCGF